MPDQALTEASVFMWSRERELVPVYDRLQVLGATTDCLAEIQELCALQRDKMGDCDALLASLGVHAPGDYLSLETGDDVETVLRMVWTRENQSLDGGWLRVDPLIEDENARAILIRGSRRHARQLHLLREIARRCGFTLVVVVTPGPAPAPMPPAPGPILGVLDYIVQPGDTMWLISRRFGVSLDALIRTNPQVRNPELIFPGEIIHIPGAGMAPSMPGPGLGPVAGDRRYVVMQGETIETVARKFGLSVSELAAFNPQLQPPFTLTPGQVLMVPSAGAVG